jgi:Holliday junction DNA helicase RuvB
MYSRSRKVRLVSGLPTRQLFQEIHHHARHGDVSNRALGFYLLDLERRHEHQTPGAVSAVDYAVGALGRNPDEARDLLRVARALEYLPELDRAFARSDVSWSKLREITRVAVPETELEWLAFAREHNCRKVEAAVSGRRLGEKPPDPNGLGTPRVKFRIQYVVPADVNVVWQTAMEKILAELGKGARPADALKAVAEMVLGTDRDEKIPPGRHARKEPVYGVVYHVGPDGQAWHQAQDGRTPIPIEAVLAVQALASSRSYPGAEVIEVPQLEPTGPDGVDAILLGERGSVPKDARDRPTPDWMRKVVLTRDGHSCVLCGSRENVTPHHVDSLANGGKTIVEKLVSFCGRHHTLVHGGLIKVVVDERGRVSAKDRLGRTLGREVSAREVLADAPEELAFTELEPEEKNSTWSFSESQVVTVPHSPARETTRSTEELVSAGEPTATAASLPVEVEATGGEPAPAPEPASAGERDLETAVARLPESAETAGRARIEAEKNSTWSSSESQVVSPPRSPMSRRLAHASLEQLPAVLTAREWRALEGRLEWTGKAFVLREDGGFEPEHYPAPGLRNDEGSSRLSDDPSSTRPGSLAEIIGQEHAVEGLSVAVEAARLRGDALGHVLLSGEPGLGKTTLAGALAREMGSRLHTAMGGQLKEPANLIGLLGRLEPRDVLFIDEIHGLRRPVTECLHAAMEDRVIDVVVLERGRVRPLRVELEPFTLAGATMEPGLLPEAFRARFGIRARLEPYAEDIIALIVERAGPALGLEVPPGAAMAIARRSRGTPREGLRLLRSARDVAQVARSSVIEVSHVEESARLLGIDPDGLGPEDRRILEVLVAHRRPGGSPRPCPMGIQTLAAMTGIDLVTIRNNHEPYLLRKGYLVRTARGRAATLKARFRIGASESDPGRRLA